MFMLPTDSNYDTREPAYRRRMAEGKQAPDSTEAQGSPAFLAPRCRQKNLMRKDGVSQLHSSRARIFASLATPGLRSPSQEQL